MPHRRVLVVDDSPDICEALVDLIQHIGYEAHAETSGERALELFEQVKPHIVLVDLWMPGMNGYDVVRHLRGQPGGGDLLIVAMTGSTATVQDSREAGVDVHLQKPIGAAVLRALFHFPDV